MSFTSHNRKDPVATCVVLRIIVVVLILGVVSVALTSK